MKKKSVYTISYIISSFIFLIIIPLLNMGVNGLKYFFINPYYNSLMLVFVYIIYYTLFYFNFKETIKIILYFLYIVFNIIFIISVLTTNLPFDKNTKLLFFNLFVLTNLLISINHFDLIKIFKIQKNKNRINSKTFSFNKNFFLKDIIYLFLFIFYILIIFLYSINKDYVITDQTLNFYTSSIFYLYFNSIFFILTLYLSFNNHFFSFTPLKLSIKNIFFIIFFLLILFILTYFYKLEIKFYNILQFKNIFIKHLKILISNHFKNIHFVNIIFYLNYAFIEEYIYRYFLMETLIKIKLKKMSIIVSSILFFLIHTKYMFSIYGLLHSLILLLTGIYFSYIYYRYRNLYFNTFIHSTYNILLYLFSMI